MNEPNILKRIPTESSIRELISIEDIKELEKSVSIAFSEKIGENASNSEKSLGGSLDSFKTEKSIWTVMSKQFPSNSSLASYV